LAGGDLEYSGLRYGSKDVATYPVEEYVQMKPDTEFSQLWIENRALIYGGLVVGNFTHTVYTGYANKAKELEDVFQKETGLNFGDDISVVVKGGDELIQAFSKEIGITLRKVSNDNLLSKAKQWQGKGNYPGVDDWVVVEIPKGTKIHGGLPGQSEFYFTTNNISLNGNSSKSYWESLQVKPDATLGYRPTIGEYEVTKDIQVVISKTLANPQYGNGGAWQLFIENYNTDLKLIKEIKLP